MHSLSQIISKSLLIESSKKVIIEWWKYSSIKNNFWRLKNYIIILPILSNWCLLTIQEWHNYTTQKVEAAWICIERWIDWLN